MLGGRSLFSRHAKNTVQVIDPGSCIYSDTCGCGNSCLDVKKGRMKEEKERSYLFK
jgi:hypothetical protein